MRIFSSVAFLVVLFVSCAFFVIANSELLTLPRFSVVFGLPAPKIVQK